jgi:hypothetical protein
MVRFSMRPITESANFSVASEVKDGKARIVVNAMNDQEEFLNFLNVSARGINPDLKGFDVDFTQVGPGRYVAEVDAESSGNYLFSVFPGEGYERLTTGVNVPYSSEFRDRKTNEPFLNSLVQFDVANGEKGTLIKGELDEQGLEDLLSVNTFRPSLSVKIDIRDIWPLLLVVCGGVFFADVFVRRVAVNFAFIPRAIAHLRGRQHDVQAGVGISRLQMRKAEIEKQIETRRAQTRFSPQVETSQSGQQKLEQVIGDEIDESADRRRPTPKAKETPFTGGPEEKSYTSRLLDAKRAAQQKQKRADDDDSSKPANQ